MKLTPPRVRALQIVRDNPGIGPAAFAVKMWPDSTGHTRRSHRHSTPAGGAVGAGIKMRAGVFLGRLSKDGLLSATPLTYGRSRYYIAEAGREALARMTADGADSLT